MADEQVIIDIQVNDQDIIKAEKRTDELNDSIQELANTVKTARKQNKEYTDQQKKLNKEYDDGRISADKYEKEVDQLNKKIGKNNRTIAETSLELNKQRREQTQNLKLLKSEVGTQDSLRARRNLLNAEIENTNRLTAEGSARFEELRGELSVINEEINSTSLSFKKTSDNVGNYTDSINKANGFTSDISGTMQNLPGFAGKASGAVDGLGDTFSALAANPVVLILSVIIGLLATLGAAFKRSATGSRLLEKAGAALESIMLTLTKIVEPMARAIEKAFDDPKGAVIDLWESIKTNIVNRFLAIPILFKSTFGILVSLFQIFGAKVRQIVSKIPLIGKFIDADKAAEDLIKAQNKLIDSTKNLATAMVQLSTGMDAEQQKENAKATENWAKTIRDFTNAMLGLNEAQFQFRQSSRTLERDIAKLNVQLEFLTKTADDNTKSLKERNAASLEAAKIAAEVAQKEKQLAEGRLALVNREIKIRRSAGQNIQDLLDQQLEAQKGLIDAEKTAVLTERDLQQQRTEILRDDVERRLDILIDGFDKVKTINENIISNDQQTFERRRALLDETVKLSNGSFQAQLSQLEGFVTDRSKLNDLIKIQDATVLQERIQNLAKDDIIAGRLLEIVKERQQALRDFAEINEELSREEIERRQEANETIAELENEKSQSIIEDKIKVLEAEEGNVENIIELNRQLKDQLIEFENEKLARQLENQVLTAEERKALTLETELAIAEIERNFREMKTEEITKADEENIERIQSNFDKINDITKQFAGEEYAVFGELTDNLLKLADKQKISFTDAFNSIGAVAQSLFASFKAGREGDLKDLETQTAHRLEVHKGDEEAQLKIQEQAKRRSDSIKRRQFYADKASALIQIGIQTALAVTKALPNIPLSLFVGGLGIAQAVFVATRQAPTFGKGGTMVDAGSHASGNDMNVIGYRKDGSSQALGRVEGDESMYVLNKNASKALALSSLNQKFGGVAFNTPRSGSFQDGGQVDTGQPSQPGATAEDIAGALENVTIVVGVEDIIDKVAQRVEVVDNAKV